MNLQRAILNVLEASPRPITARIIASIAPQFSPQPALPANVDKAQARVAAECEAMEQTGDVLSQPSRDFGPLWAITKTGRLRLA